MRSNYRRKWDKLNLKVESIFRRYSYRKAAKLRLKRMNGGYNCDKEYDEIIVPFWNQFNYKPQKYWYQIFSDREQKVDPRYIPDDLWYGTIIPYYSNPQFRRFGEDKCLHDVWFPELERPQTIMKNIAGVFYDAEMNIINQETAMGLCLQCKDEYLIKPSIDSGEGRLIKFFDKNSQHSDILETFNQLKANYIAQGVVKQHKVLSELNASSLNTIRIVSFLFEGDVYILSAILRIGASGSKVDNIGNGGYACPILEDGQLKSKGVNRQAQWVEEVDKGIRFSEVVIPNYHLIINAINETHEKFAHFKLIGWDFAIDQDAQPVFIEFNTCPGSNQITCGPTFGDITEKVLYDVLVEKKLKYAQN